MRALPPTFWPLWQRPAHCAACGGIAFDFNADTRHLAGHPARGFPARSGFHMATLSFALRSGPFGAGPSFRHRQSLADGAGSRKFPFSSAMDAVESALIKTLTRGSHKWLRNTLSSHLFLPSRLLAAFSRAAMAIHRHSTAQPCAPSVVLPPVPSSQAQPVARARKERLSARLRAAAHASFRAPTTATDLPAASRPSVAADRLSTDHSKTGSFSHTGWKTLFICCARSGPALPEGRTRRCSRKS